MRRAPLAVVLALLALVVGLRLWPHRASHPRSQPDSAQRFRARTAGVRSTPPLRLPEATAVPEATAAEGELGGRVLSSADGAPIARAALTFLHQGAALLTECDGAGRFVVRAPTAGAYELASATASGFVSFEPELGHSPVTVQVRGGVRLTDVTIYLQPALELTVVVEDEARHPIAGAEVRAFDHARGSGDARPILTDARGEARLSAQPWQTLEARHAGFLRARASVDPAAQQTRRVRLRLAAGADRARATISGVVIDRRGQPVDGALVEAWVRLSPEVAEPAWAQVQSGADGRFTLAELDDIVYSLRAAARGYGAVARDGVRAGSRDVTLRLGAPDAGIAGTVRDPGGKPVTAFTVLAWPRLGTLGRGPEERATVIDAEGRYQLTLPSGSWLVSAAARGFARSDEHSIDVADATVTVDLTLRAGGRVFGRVVERGSGAPLAGAHVELEGDAHGDGVTLAYDATTAADGAFALDGLPPGRVALLASAAAHHGRILSGLELANGALGPLTIDLLRVEPGEEPKTELVGVGAVIGPDESATHLTIRQAMPGGGAADAGLVAGDLILAVDGTAVDTLGFADAIQMIRGPEGSVVALTIRRKDGSTQVVAVVRKRITT